MNKSNAPLNKEGCHWGGSISRSKASNLSITVDVGTDKMQLKLRAIAKHVGALADELDAIDNAWRCEYCGHGEYTVHHILGQEKLCKCAKCDEKCVVPNDELPTRLEGSQ